MPERKRKKIIMRGFFLLLLVGFIAVANARNPTIKRHKRSWRNAGVVFARGVVGADAEGIQDEIFDKLSTVKSNECKCSITHVKRRESAGFHTEWETETAVNPNDLTLNGDVGELHTETITQTVSGTGHLKIARFHPRGYPCITAVSIACGDQVVRGGGIVAISMEDTRQAWSRKGNDRFIEVDWGPPQCVKFHRDGKDNGFKAMDVYPGVFDCNDDRHCNGNDVFPGVFYCTEDSDCIQRHLEVF